jgi:hypothetical protein
MTGWTDSETAVLKDLTARGYSAGQIAPLVGHSRNAVIGKWTRMGGAVQARSPHSSWDDDNLKILRKMWIAGYPASQIADKLGLSLGAVQHKLLRIQGTSKRRFYKQIHVMPLAKHKKLPTKRPKPAAPPIGPTVTFRGHKDSQCKYIDGDPKGADTLFCANDRLDGFSYCAGHAIMCYEPRARRSHRPFLLMPSNPALAAQAAKS